MATRIIQLCNTKGCYKPGEYWSQNKRKYVCEACADPDAKRGGFGPHGDDTDTLTPINPRAGDGWKEFGYVAR